MRVPFSALQSRPPAFGERFRINLFRSQGPPPNRVAVVWQPTMSDTFHIPEKFGLLRLIEATAKQLFRADALNRRAPPRRLTSRISSEEHSAGLSRKSRCSSLLVRNRDPVDKRNETL